MGSCQYHAHAVAVSDPHRRAVQCLGYQQGRQSRLLRGKPSVPGPGPDTGTAPGDGLEQGRCHHVEGAAGLDGAAGGGWRAHAPVPHRVCSAAEDCTADCDGEGASPQDGTEAACYSQVRVGQARHMRAARGDRARDEDGPPNCSGMTPVLVPETTMETKTIYEQKFISIPRQAMIKKPMVKMVKKEIEVPEEYFEEEPAQEMQYYDEQTYETIEVPQTYNETYTEMVAVVREAVPVPVKKKVMQKRPVQKMRKSLQAVEVGTTSQVVGQQFVGQEAVNQQMLASGAYGNYTTSPAAYASGIATSSPSSSSNLFATNDGSTAGGITYNADGSISYK